MSLSLDISRLSREVQRPFEVIAKRFPLGSQDLQDGSVGPSALLASSQIASASADVTITGTTVAAANDITGCSITTPANGIGTFIVVGVFDFDHTGAGAGVALGQLRADGTAEGSLATLSQTAVRGTVTQVWAVPFTAGSKVLKLQAWKTVAAGTLVAHQVFTRLLVFGPV